MSVVLLVIVGAIVGAASTGGAAWVERLRQREDRSRVAARLILGDLIIAETMLGEVLRIGTWPEQIDLSAPASVWNSCREDFADGTDAGEWITVDNAYSELQRIGLVVEPGGAVKGRVAQAVENLAQYLPEARKVALEHAARPGERDSLLEGLQVRENMLNGVPG